MGPGGLARKFITQAVLPGAASEGAGQLTKGTALEPYARVAGGIAGAVAAPAAVRAIMPAPISAERAATLNQLRAEGIEPTAARISDSKRLLALEGDIGGAAANDAFKRQGSGLGSAVMRRAGVSGGEISADTLQQARERITRNADDLASHNPLYFDQMAMKDLSETGKIYGAAQVLERRASTTSSLISISACVPMGVS
jgi:hypothetical protein